MEELRTLASVYELTCHLVHLDVEFLMQFCAIVEFIASDVLIHLLSAGKRTETKASLASGPPPTISPSHFYRYRSSEIH